MATGIKQLRTIQCIPEATPGSPLAATEKWRGVGAGPEILDDIQFVEDGRAFNVRCSIGLTMIDAETDKPEDALAQARHYGEAGASALNPYCFASG